jgi:hypothetical protein
VQVQGYLISRPVPLEDAARFVAGTRQRLSGVWQSRSAGWTQTRTDSTGEHASPVTFLRPRSR